MSFYDQDIADAPQYTKISERDVVARKEYVCADCGRPIKVGTKHYKHVYIYEGAFVSDRSHSRGGSCAYYEALADDLARNPPQPFPEDMA